VAEGPLHHPSPVPDAAVAVLRRSRSGGERHRTGRERGQALPLVAGVLALVVVLALGAVRVGAAAHDRARAHTAADAAALAGAAGGRAAADRMASANGAHLAAYREQGSEVEVEVELGGARATARARLQW